MTSSSVADSCSSVYGYNPSSRYLENRNPSLPGEALRSRDCFSANTSNAERPWEMLSANPLPEGTDPIDGNSPSPLLPSFADSVPSPPKYLKNYQFGSILPSSNDGPIPTTTQGGEEGGVVRRGSMTKPSKGFESNSGDRGEGAKKAGGDVDGEKHGQETRNYNRRDSKVVIIE